jgi:hypothetical protein
MRVPGVLGLDVVSAELRQCAEDGWISLSVVGAEVGDGAGRQHEYGEHNSGNNVVQHGASVCV